MNYKWTIQLTWRLQILVQFLARHFEEKIADLYIQLFLLPDFAGWYINATRRDYKNIFQVSSTKKIASLFAGNLFWGVRNLSETTKEPKIFNYVCNLSNSFIIHFSLLLKKLLNLPSLYYLITLGYLCCALSVTFYKMLTNCFVYDVSVGFIT